MLNNVVAFYSGGAAAGDFESIATVTVGSGGAANVEFTSIAADWTHLQVRAIHHGTTTSSNQPAIKLTFNSVTSNYAWHGLEGSGTSAYAYAMGASTDAIYIYSTPANTYSASTFGAHIIDILDYANTNKYKTVRSLGGEDDNGKGYISFNSGLHQSTSAITSIKFTPALGNFSQYSHFALYGIKAA